MNITMKPIGRVLSSRTKIADDNWDQEKTVIELDHAQFSPSALKGLEDYSHVEVVFFMDQIDANKIETGLRHPRNNLAWPKVGIFAQRAKNRPNRIACTICRIKRIEGNSLYVEGLDAIDGSPVLDIKPWLKEFAPRGQVFQPGWATELMQKYF